VSAFPLVPLRAVTLDAQTGPFGSQLHSDDYVDGGIPVINPSNIINSKITPDPAAAVTEDTSERLARHRLEPGDLVFGRRGELGRAAVVHNEAAGWLCGTGSLRVRTRQSAFDSHFAEYVLQSAGTRSYFEMYAVGSTMGNLNTSIVLGLTVPLPPLDEQRRLADFLDAETTRIDYLASLQKTALEKLHERDRALRDSLIDKLVSQVGELPFRRFISKIEQGTSPQCENYPRESGNWGVLKLSAVKGGRFYPEENKQLPEDVSPVREYEVRDGDLLISRANTPELVGDVAVAEGAHRKLLLPDLIYRVGLNRSMKADFAAQVLLSTRVRRMIQATARGSSQSMVKIRGEDIREWRIPYANARQQEELVLAVRGQTDSSDRLRSVVTRQLALLAERRQALITAAVTGEITV
jgi:type I restriction enzyme S subunit